MNTRLALEFHPLTPDRWMDFEELFGPHGAYGGCWCMWWRSTRREFERRQGEGNRQAMKAIVEIEVPGILAYQEGKALGWCSVAPRERFTALQRSPILRPLDDAPVWSIVCFYVAKGYRGQGMAEALLCGAVEYVREQGGRVIEAYPTVPRGKRLPPVSSYMGLLAMFERAGFVPVANPSPSRVIVRYYLDG